MSKWTKNRVLAAIAFSALLLSFGFQNCSKVGVQDLASMNEKNSGQGLVIGDEEREIVEDRQGDDGPAIVIPDDDHDDDGGTTPAIIPPVAITDSGDTTPATPETPPAPEDDKKECPGHNHGGGTQASDDGKHDDHRDDSKDEHRSEPNKDLKCLPKSQVAEEQGKACKPNKKNPCVVICHIPPGNPANRHEIVVGMSATTAHTKHGDQIGKCPPLEDDEKPLPVCDDDDDGGDDDDLGNS